MNYGRTRKMLSNILSWILIKILYNFFVEVFIYYFTFVYFFVRPLLIWIYTWKRSGNFYALVETSRCTRALLSIFGKWLPGRKPIKITRPNDGKWITRTAFFFLLVIFFNDDSIKRHKLESNADWLLFRFIEVHFWMLFSIFFAFFNWKLEAIKANVYSF